MTKKQLMYERIEKHGENLNAIFNTGLEPIALCKKLRRLEIKAHKLATDYCNGDNGITAELFYSESKIILRKLEKILGMDSNTAGFFINGDPRGYALKIESDVVRENALDIYTDLGGYGIISPDFNE